ncbi:MAG: class I SAM-dependent methyltransferase [Candidatus Daviesbacteria bacterium]|nr:class I SAM-dependent methyltransferase [Candidatus Daviesbacteria bacterium]
MHPTYKYILSLLNLQKAEDNSVKVVDYGCGNGLLLSYLVKRKIKEYIGFDINKESILEAKRKYHNKNISFLLLSRNKKMFERMKSVDLLVLIGVLQYLSEEEIDWLLLSSQKILKKKGRIIISCTPDNWPYRLFNLYRIILPNKFINKDLFIDKAKKNGFEVSACTQKGLLLAPLFSNIIVIFFDFMDKLVFKTKGKLGPVGIVSRKVINPLLMLEYLLPINYGYTMFVELQKNEK